MTNETLKKHEKTCDICQTTNPENKIGKRLATKAIQRNSEKVMTSKKQQCKSISGWQDRCDLEEGHKGYHEHLIKWQRWIDGKIEK